MSAVMSVDPAARIAASPYARRLARERGISLAGRRGSGPNGRIVAADLVALAAAPAPEPQVAPPQVAIATPPATVSPAREQAPQRQLSGFAASLDIAPLRALIPTVADVAPDVTVDDLILKAIGRALRLAETGAETIDWRDKAQSGTVMIPRADGLSPSRIASLRAGGESEAPRGSTMIVSRIREDGLRPVASALGEGSALRLTLVFAEDDVAEALLTFDEAEIGDAVAARFLAVLRDCLAVPLRLLV